MEGERIPETVRVPVCFVFKRTFDSRGRETDVPAETVYDDVPLAAVDAWAQHMTGALDTAQAVARDRELREAAAAAAAPPNKQNQNHVTA